MFFELGSEFLMLLIKVAILVVMVMVVVVVVDFADVVLRHRF